MNGAKSNYQRAATRGKAAGDPNTNIYEQNLDRVTKALADEIWDAHHDDAMRAFLYEEVDNICKHSPDE